MKYEGFVFGHYDSRGGTVFVAAASPEVASKRYLDEVMGMSSSDFLAADRDRCIKEDFMGAAILTSPEPITSTGVFPDMDQDPWQAVLKGHVNPEEFIGDPPFDILIISKDDSIPNGYGRPRWDDDAFSFMCVMAKVEEPAV